VIKAVIFDWGGVLIDNPADGLRHFCAKKLGVESDTFTKEYSKYEPDFQIGVLSEEELWKKICADLGIIPKGMLWLNAVRSTFTLKKEIVEMIKELRLNHYKIGFLSNTELPAREYFFEQCWDTLFDALVFSCVEGTLKPEKKIYQIALEKLEVQPEEAIFIDDKKSYIDGAKSIGMKGIVFLNPEQVKKELICLGVKLA